jgi:hypothetical protein
MKKNFLVFAVALISSVAFTNNTVAQDEPGINKEDMPELYSPLIINILKNSTMSDHSEDINERAVKNSHKNYPSVTNEVWSTADHGYLVTFKAGGTQTIVGYNHNGMLHHTINYYGEERNYLMR